MKIADVLFADDMDLIGKVRDQFNIDLLAQPAFWEEWVANLLGGQGTPRKAEHDAEVEIWGRLCRVEVKFSQAFFCQYKPIRGKDWSRMVFKWAKPRGGSGKKAVDALVLIGLDGDELHTWVLPPAILSEKCASLTIATPSARTAGTSGRLDQWGVPPTEILPAVARICHNKIDLPYRQRNAEATRKARA